MEKLFIQASSETGQDVNALLRVVMDAGFTVLGFGVEYVEQTQPTSNVSPAQEVPDATEAAPNNNNAAPSPKVSDAAAKLAAEAGFDLSLITEGSGKDGSITKLDVQRAIKAHALPPTGATKNASPEPAVNPNFKQYTRADVETILRRVYAESGSTGEGADRVRAILSDHNAPNVTSLYEEQYEAVYKAAEAALAAR